MNDPLLSRLGIQSWCFRKYNRVSDVIPDLKDCLVDHLEICPIHVDPADPAGAVAACREAGITISSSGVHHFSADEAACRKIFEFADLAGFETLSANIDAEALPLLDRLSAEYGKRLAVHNHGRKHRYGSVAALEDLFGRTSERIGLCLDTAWMLDSGENPLEVAKRFRDRLYGVHVKDFIFDRAGKPEDVVVGDGNLDLPGLMRYLRNTDFAGYLTLEYEGDVGHPVPALRKCVEAIRRA